MKIKQLAIGFTIIVATSCGSDQIDFDQQAWNERDDFMYANREKMVTDLIENHLHRGMNYQEVIRLLGPDDNFANLDSHEIGYEIEVDYGSDIDPVDGIVMVLEFTEDSTLINYRLDKWK